MSGLDHDGFGPDNLIALDYVSRETISDLTEYVAILDEWRQKMNLIGPKEMGHIWRRHVFDSLLLAPYIRQSSAVLDLGAGAGFPGLVLAILAKESGAHVTLVESVGKKCSFLRHVSEALSLPTTIYQGRVEAMDDEAFSADIVTARAFAPLPKLVDYALPWLLNGASAILPKGERWEEELTEAQEYWKFAYDVIPSQSGSGVLLKLSEVSLGGNSYPYPSRRQSKGRRR